jgi:hypothetical protein
MRPLPIPLPMRKDSSGFATVVVNTVSGLKPPHIHPFYTFWFTRMDPLTLRLTSATCFLNPAAALEIVVPADVSPFVPPYAAILQQIGILYIFKGTMHAILRRASSDLKVGKIVQAVTIGVHVALIATIFVSLETHGRLELGR